MARSFRDPGGLVEDGMLRTNLLTRLLILVVMATVPAVLVMGYLQQDLRSDARVRLADEALRQAELLNADIGNVVEGARQLALAISHFNSVRNGEPGCGERLLELRADLPSYAMLSVIDADGQILCSDGDPAAWASPAVAAHVKEVVAGGHFDVGTFMPATPQRVAILPFVMPFITNSGRPEVVMVGLNLDWLGAHLSELKRAPDSTIGIGDRNGITIARFPDGERSFGRPLPELIRDYVNVPHRGNAVVTGFDGKERLIGFVPATEQPVGLFVSIGLNLPSMMVDVDRTTWRGAMLIAAGALMSLFLVLLAGERFVRRPTAALLAAATRWSSGDLSARAELRQSAASEFGQLAAAFNGMAAALGKQRAELQDLNATLEARVDERTRDLVSSRNRLQVEMAEREKTEATLRQSQKLQAVGQLAGGIAHDFNNLLTAVIGAIDLLRARLPAGQDALVRLADSALHAAERGSKLTNQLLSFSRKQRLLPVATDLNMTVLALSDLLGSTLGRSVRIQTDLVQDLWPAMVDPNQVEAAIINLAINARDAMPDGGVLTLSTRNVEIAVGGALAAGDYVAVRVSDTGTGMAPEIVARVFEPFFTTKEPGRGSGLGLSQVHGLSVQSGGDIRIDSIVGAGTIVTLLLPRALAVPLAARRDAILERQGPRRRARLLVVDDDRDVLMTTGEMLSERGYAVTLASNGDEALAALATQDGFDAMATDYVMPGMNGLALIQAAQKLRPGLRCLLVTGHAELDGNDAIDPENIVRKPFNVATLEERVERLLAQPMLRGVRGGLAAVGD